MSAKLSAAKVKLFSDSTKHFHEKVNLCRIVSQRYMAIIIDDTILTNQADNLKAAMSTDPKMRKVIQQHIREALFAARREVMAAFPAENGDPRESRRSIRTTVYEKILGGNINILTGKSAKGASGGVFVQPRRAYHDRGGNLRKQSERTKQILNYGPLQRGFILRFVNSGTKQRVIGFRNTVKGNREKYDSAIRRINRGNRTGNRGSIAARNWFTTSAESALGNAAQMIAGLIEIEAAAIANGE